MSECDLQKISTGNAWNLSYWQRTTLATCVYRVFGKLKPAQWICVHNLGLPSEVSDRGYLEISLTRVWSYHYRRQYSSGRSWFNLVLNDMLLFLFSQRTRIWALTCFGFRLFGVGLQSAMRQHYSAVSWIAVTVSAEILLISYGWHTALGRCSIPTLKSHNKSRQSSPTLPKR